MIEVHGVTKRYGATPVLHDISLTIPAGKVTSIVGPNGAGKSTLLGIIGRLLPADAGTVLVDGHDVGRTATDVLARRLSVLRQENHMTVRLTVRELVAFGRFPYSKGRLRADDVAAIDDAIGYLELGELAERYLDELSGGQRQRAFVAMVLCQDTDYILLDEPLNNLDLRHGVQMMRLVRRMAEELGKTIVVVIHDINFASCHSDEIIAMRDGAVVGQGPVAEMIDAAVLREVYDLDIEVHELGGQRIGVYYR